MNATNQVHIIIQALHFSIVAIYGLNQDEKRCAKRLILLLSLRLFRSAGSTPCGNLIHSPLCVKCIDSKRIRTRLPAYPPLFVLSDSYIYFDRNESKRIPKWIIHISRRLLISFGHGCSLSPFHNVLHGGSNYCYCIPSECLFFLSLSLSFILRLFGMHEIHLINKLNVYLIWFKGGIFIFWRTCSMRLFTFRETKREKCGPPFAINNNSKQKK